MEPRDVVRDESGAILALAVVFMIAVALMILTLSNLTISNLQATTNLTNQRMIESAADGMTTLAVQTVRYSQTQGYPGGTCASTTGTVNTISVRVECTIRTTDPDTATKCPPQNGVPGGCRVVEFVACQSSAPSPCPASQRLIDANVVFDDFDSNGNTSVGYSASVLSWTVTPANG
jgi:hypothetical protein